MGRECHIPLNDGALAALMTANQYSSDGPAVFWNRYGEPLQTPRQWFEEAFENAKIDDFRWHDLRHTFARRLVMAGVDLRTVEQLCPASQEAQQGATDTTTRTSRSKHQLSMAAKPN